MHIYIAGHLCNSSGGTQLGYLPSPRGCIHVWTLEKRKKNRTKDLYIYTYIYIYTHMNIYI